MWKKKINKNGREKFGIAYISYCGNRWLDILLDILQYCKIFSDIAKYFAISCNIVQYCQILSSIAQYRSGGFFSSLFHLSGCIIMDIANTFQIFSNIIKHCLILSAIDQFCQVAPHGAKKFENSTIFMKLKEALDIVRNNWIFRNTV